jgi:sigma-B regulation protein RsbQ
MNVLNRHNVRVLGNEHGQPVVMAHGFGCDQTMWRYLVPAFQRDYRIILFDYVGHGGAERTAFDPKRYASLEGYAQDLLEICRQLELEDVVLIAHSVSATIGMLAALREPERFAKLIMIGPSPCYIDDGDYRGGFTRDQLEELLAFLDENPLGWSNAMAPTIMGNGDRPDLAEELASSFCRTDPTVAKAFARVTFLSDNRADLPRLRTRSLILQCSNDVIAGEAVGRYVHEQLPNSVFLQLSATGHCPHLSAPQQTIAAIHSFLIDDSAAAGGS